MKPFVRKQKPDAAYKDQMYFYMWEGVNSSGYVRRFVQWFDALLFAVTPEPLPLFPYYMVCKKCDRWVAVASETPTPDGYVLDCGHTGTADAYYLLSA